MPLVISSPFCLLLSFVALSFSFQIPSLISDDCFKDVEQSCDGEESLTKADASALNSTVRYFLFTRKNPKNPEMLHLCNGTLPKNTNFNPKEKLIVVIPGFMFGICQLSVYREIKDEYLKKDDYNILIIDPRKEYGIDYVEVPDKFSAIAKQVSRVLQNIQDQTGIKNNGVELVGHSLGAQLCSQISEYFKVHRITGIDPAGPLFTEATPANQRLDDSDAELVEVLHCNGGQGLPNFGIEYPAGDADFFINGGAMQLNCRDLAIGAVKDLDIALALVLASSPTICSHLICASYYKLSINNEYGYFKAWECDNYKDFKDGKCAGNQFVIMGLEYEKNFMKGEVKKPFPRKYYIDTEPKYPYVKKNDTTISNLKL